MAIPAKPATEVSRRARKRELFIKMIETIRPLVASGQSMQAAFEESGASEKMGYHLFIRYVGRFLAEDSRIQRRSSSTPHGGTVTPAVSNIRPPQPPDLGQRDTEVSAGLDAAIQTPKENSHEPKRGPLPVVRHFRPHKGPVSDSDVCKRTVSTAGLRCLTWPSTLLQRRCPDPVRTLIPTNGFFYSKVRKATRAIGKFRPAVGVL